MVSTLPKKGIKDYKIVFNGHVFPVSNIFLLRTNEPRVNRKLWHYGL